MLRIQILALAIVLPLFMHTAYGQETKGSILGSITDSAGASVPGAGVTILNEKTGYTFTQAATAVGEYTFVNLDPGSYAITVTATGFKKSVIRDITLFVAQKARIDVKLAIGEVASSIEVQATMPVVQSEQASIGSVVDSKQISQMPLNGRSSLFGLMALAPGFTRASVNPLMAGATWAGSVNMTVDGASNTDVGGARILPIGPSLESISEFSVVSNGTSAEYGRGGAQIIVATRQGTNEFHGTLFAFNRNRVTAAKNFFATGLEKPAFNRNEYGGSFGGPIVKNKLFFFGTYEGLQMRSSATYLVAMPTAALKSGNFAGLPAIRDPFSNGAPFANNQIPTSRIHSTANELMRFTSEPNLPGTGAAGLGNNFAVNVPSQEFNDRYTIRTDYELSSRDRISFRYFHVANGPYMQASNGTDKFGNWGGNGTGTKNAIGSYTRILSPTLIAESRFGFQHANLYRQPQNSDYDPSKYIPNLIPPIEGLGGLPTVTITGFRGFDDKPGSADRMRRYEFFQNLTWSRAHHTVKAGFDFSRASAFNLANTNPFRGSFRFDGRYSGHAWSDFLLGASSLNGRASKNSLFEPVNNRWSAFIQDDWKVSHNLTVNIGLRYDFYGLFFNSMGDLSNFDPSLGKVVLLSGTPDPRLMAQLPIVDGKELGLNQSNYLNNDRNNFAPRIGIAYRPFGGTRFVIRAAYGIYYNDGGGYTFLGVPSNPPFIVSETFEPAAGTVPSLTWDNPFPGVGTIPSSPRVASWARDRVTPYQQQWNFTLEGEVVRNTSLRVSYLGNLGLHLDRINTLNEPRMAPGAVQSRRPYQPFGAINYQETSRNSILHALQVGVIRRHSNGLSFQVEYQFNRALGENTFSAGPMDNTNYRLDRGNLDYVRRHVVTANYVYDLPFGKGRTFLTDSPRIVNKLVSGWQLSGITSIGTGEPFSVTFTSTTLGWTSNRADIVGNPDPGERSIAQWFNPAAFAVPAPFTFGNSSRNLLFGPGYFNCDAGLLKITPITERTTLEIRAEAFNLPNRANFGLPASDISVASAVGRITSAADARTLQFGARLRF